MTKLNSKYGIYLIFKKVNLGKISFFVINKLKRNENEFS